MHWIPAALAVAMIAVESTATMSADNTSHWLLPIWVHLFGPITADRWSVVHHWIRKTGHFVGYGLVSAAFFHGWNYSIKTRSYARPLNQPAAFLAVCSTLLVSIADEYHQSFLPNRTSSPYDVLIDLCGAVAALLILALLPPLSRRMVAQKV
ncbi:MAG TPA: VanZ family protein [Acidobacteriaceae bacterium]